MPAALPPQIERALSEGGEALRPVEVAGRLREVPGLVFLDSSAAEDPGAGPDSGRYSFVVAHPIAIHRGRIDDPADYARLSATLAARRTQAPQIDQGFPAAGLYGYVGYGGEYCFGEYEACLVHDQIEDRWQACGDFRAWGGLESLLQPAPATERPTRLAGSALPAFASSGPRRKGFLESVERAREYIAAGDIYQVNLSHRFDLEAPLPYDEEPVGTLFGYYESLRATSPAPYAAYLRLGGREILSSSPELFLRLSGRVAATRPIKGTRPRFRDAGQDEKSAYDLITSAKEIAELVMITDLERNDLGQICEYGSVRATDLLKLERYAQVFHLVSTVEGRLRPEVDHLAALAACFPGGSITGAPKKRAREIIAELEPVPRGLYTGAVGCFGDNGESRFSIAIRTAVREGSSLHFHVGAGIVADSVPESEWEETLHKAAGLLQAWERYRA